MIEREPSKYWPYIKQLANIVTIPGSSIGLKPLADLQDDLSKGRFDKAIVDALNHLVGNTDLVVQELRKLGEFASPEDINVSIDDTVERLYLSELASNYYYADFKGIQQDSTFRSLPLDDIFVGLRLSREHSTPEMQQHASMLQKTILEADANAARQIEQDVELKDAQTSRAMMDREYTIDEVLSAPGIKVILGGPGSGKTTLVKRVARSAALGSAAMNSRYPRMPSGMFPVVVPIVDFASSTCDDLIEYIKSRLGKLGSESLARVFQRKWTEGSSLLLLDGLDEIAAVDHRVRSARAIDLLEQSCGQNRVVITTRIVGYSLCRLSVPSEHLVLLPFSRDDVRAFVFAWYEARERVEHREAIRIDEARQDARRLMHEIQRSAGVASLASNPLMLTIIALIKQRDVQLPERRVELYDLAINTLLKSWNMARSMSGRPLGQEPHVEETRRVWGYVAHWMHNTQNRVVHRRVLHDKLIEVLVERAEHSEAQATKEAESYLEAAAHSSGLLEARGPTSFAFVHQTFQEYLAADRLAIPPRRAAERIESVIDDPRWYEPIRLACGIVGVFQRDTDTLEEIVDRVYAQTPEVDQFLCTRIRVLAGCISDNVGFLQRHVDRVLVDLVRCSESLPQSLSVQAEFERHVSALPLVNPQAVSKHAVESLVRYALSNSRISAADGILGKLVQLAAYHKVVQDALVQLMRYRDSAIRARAASGLLKCDGVDAIDLLRKVAKNARYRSAIYLDTAQINEAIEKLIVSDDREERLFAACLLARRKRYVEAKIIVENDLLADSQISMAFLDVLGAWPKYEGWIRDTVVAFVVRHRRARWAAASVVFSWYQNDGADDCVDELASHADSGVKSLFVQVSRRAKKSQIFADVLEQMILDDDELIRTEAADMIYRQDPMRHDAMKILVESLSHRDEDVATESLYTLRAFAREHPVTARALIAARPNVKNWTVAMELGDVLYEIGESHSAERILKDVATTASGRVRVYAIARLRENGCDIANHVETMVAALAEADVRSRSMAIEVLASMILEDAESALVMSLLDHENDSTRKAAASVLGGWAPTCDLLKVVGKAVAEEDVEVLENAMTACNRSIIAAYGYPGVAPIVQRIVASKDARAEVVLHWFWKDLGMPHAA